MSNTTIAVWTVGWCIVFLIVYRFVFNPQILIIPSVLNLKGCPDHWSRNGSMCLPPDGSVCKAFNPANIKTLSQACAICKSCGTNWNGQC